MLNLLVFHFDYIVHFLYHLYMFHHLLYGINYYNLLVHNFTIIIICMFFSYSIIYCTVS